MRMPSKQERAAYNRIEPWLYLDPKTFQSTLKPDAPEEVVALCRKYCPAVLEK